MSSSPITLKACWTLDDLREWKTISPALDPPARLAVIGDPVAHSLSPPMHNPALAARGVHAQYIRVQVPAGKVREAMVLFQEQGFIGVNCTIPHKFEALTVMDEVDPLAKELGAVNTVHFRDGIRCGFNSDGPGFLRAVEEVFGTTIRGIKVLITGAGGGAGQAVAKQCALAGCSRLYLVNRTTEKIADLTAAIQGKGFAEVQTAARSAPQLKAFVAEADLIVNATSLGLKMGDEEVLPHELLTARHRVFDMVYRRDGKTPLVAAAEKAGAAVCDGLPLLLHQGAASFAHWFGKPVPLEAMREGLRTATAR